MSEIVPIRYAISFKKAKHNYFIASPIPEIKLSVCRQDDNIFAKTIRQYNHSQVGPRLDSKGQIVKYTIVGKPESFLQMSRGGVDSSIKDSFHQIDATPSSKVQRKISQNSRVNHQRRISQSKIREDDIYRHMQMTQAKIYDNQMADILREKSLPLFERNQVSKERRCLENHSNQIQKWQDLQESLAEKVKRDQQKTVIARSTDYRRKLEVLGSLPDEPNNKVWYSQLRTDSRQTTEKSIFITNQTRTNRDEHIYAQQQSQSLLSDKFRSRVQSKITLKNNYLQVQGESKFSREFQSVKDTVITTQLRDEQDNEIRLGVNDQKIDYQNWNKNDLNRKGLSRIPRILTST